MDADVLIFVEDKQKGFLESWAVEVLFSLRLSFGEATASLFSGLHCLLLLLFRSNALPVSLRCSPLFVSLGLSGSETLFFSRLTQTCLVRCWVF